MDQIRQRLHGLDKTRIMHSLVDAPCNGGTSWAGAGEDKQRQGDEIRRRS